MEFLKDRRIVVAGGVALALLAGLLLAVLINGGDKGENGPPPASQAGLVVNMGGDNDIKPKSPLRCFVGGQFVGVLMLDECAKKNGVATSALDMGIDETGALAASENLGSTITPLPPTGTTPVVAPPVPAATAPATPAEPAQPRVATASCQRYDRSWSRVGDLSLNACVQALFEGRCERAGSATYGRWGDQTLRLVPGRVELSLDDRSFRTLVEQGGNCSVPQL